MIVGEPHIFWFFGAERHCARAIALDGLLDEAHGDGDCGAVEIRNMCFSRMSLDLVCGFGK